MIRAGKASDHGLARITADVGLRSSSLKGSRGMNVPTRTTTDTKLRGGVTRGAAQAGFTLIELLIVIFIIGILISLLTVAVKEAKKKSNAATASADISKFVQAIAAYNSDKGTYPGYDKIPDESDLENFNAFPSLFQAVYYDSSQGGGPNGPYIELKVDKIAVEDLDDESGYTTAKKSEARDPEVEKYYRDPWGFPYIYRENAAKRKKRVWMIKSSKYDLWSRGPDQLNMAWQGLLDDDEYERENDEQKFDDIGNW